MNMKQAKKARALIAGVYDQSRVHAMKYVDDLISNRHTIEQYEEQKKEKVIREMLLELMEIFPEAEEKLPCDEYDY